MKYEVISKSETATLTCYILDRQADQSARELRPAVIICPGGGYAYCSDREGEAVALRFLAAGFHAFVLRYTVSGNAPTPLWPAPLLDAAWAVGTVRAAAGEWNVREDKVFLMGFSAGGHLAASLGVHWNRPEVLELCENPRPDGLILCYPVITASKLSHAGSVSNLTGGREDLIRLAKLEDFVGPGTPPAFLWHTFSDAAVPVGNSLVFADAMRKSGVPFELHIFPEGGHGYSLAVAETRNANLPPFPHVANWMPLCVEWIKEMTK